MIREIADFVACSYLQNAINEGLILFYNACINFMIFVTGDVDHFSLLIVRHKEHVNFRLNGI